MILVYTHSITTRLTYTLDLVFGSVLGIPHHVTDNLEMYRDSFIPKIAYTNENKGFGVFIESDPLLFESHIRQELPLVSDTCLNFPVFFKAKENAFLPYDIFATVFYFASRYEEYLSYESDKHQRFQAEQSLAFKNAMLDKPFLNYLITDFAQKLKQDFPILEFPEKAFKYVSTIDIDNAYAYANKGFARNAGGMAKDLASFKWKEAGRRMQSNLNESRDPYNTFDLINALSAETQTDLLYFVLIGDYAAYDKNPDYRNPGFRKLLKSLSDKYSMGLHPSYESFLQPEKIQIERTRLEDITEKKITSARCHFLRVKFPDTYRHFIEAGITDDYTMIYASQCGFRTGLCMPYQWFDLEKNEATELTIHPSAIMEGTLRDYNKLTVAKAELVANQLLNEVKRFNGEFVSIFHNDSFVPEQQLWVELYKTILKESKK